MRTIPFAVFTALAVCSVRAAEPHPDQILAASQIIIPRVEYVSATAPQILQQLRRMSEQRDPAKRGVRLIIDDTLPSPAAQKALTFAMNDTSVLNIVKHVTNVAGLEVDLRKDGL